MLCTKTFPMKTRNLAAEPKLCSLLGCRRRWDGKEEKRKKISQQHVLREAHVLSTQLGGRLDFFLLLFLLLLVLFFYYCYFPPPTEANELVGGDTRSEPRFDHSLSEPHQRDNTAQK